MKKLFVKDWILYKEEANNGGRRPEDLKETIVKPDREKHNIKIIKSDNGYTVEIEDFPNNEDHCVNLFELQVDNMTFIKELEIDEPPIMDVQTKHGNATARFFCNQHGLFQKEGE